MESVEKECGALGGLFQAIVNDMKIGVPLWEDFLAKAAKLHCQLKSTTSATSAFLDSFQKIADVATNTRGATKDIGSALTRICLRQRSVEARMKTFTNSIVECLVIPMQERLEEWKRTTVQLDKDHAKEYKKARQEIKKKSSDTLRLQKKVKKANIKGDLQRTLDYALHDVNDKFLLLEETEKQAVRSALIEERSRFCLFVTFLKPVVDEEILMLSEVTHLQEALQTLVKHSTDPYTLPSGSEQVITDLKSTGCTWTFRTPPSSPNTGSSIGSRKSSMCSISSLTSSSSSSTKSHSSPSHQYRQFRSISQNPKLGSGMPLGGTMRLCSVSSQDSGFTSQDTLFLRPQTPLSSHLNKQVSNGSDNSSSCSTSTGCVGTGSGSSITSSTPSSPYYPTITGAATNATWPLQESGQLEKSSSSGSGFSHPHITSERPHTISSAYEKFSHTRPALTSQTFQPLEIDEQIAEDACKEYENSRHSTASSTTPTAPAVDITCIADGQEPIRTSVYNVTSSDESVNTPTSENNLPLPQKYANTPVQIPVVEDKPVNIFKPPSSGTDVRNVPDFNQTAPNQIVPQPIYMNMDEINEEKRTDLPKSIPAGMSLQQELNNALKNNQTSEMQHFHQRHHRQSSDTQLTLKASQTSVLSSSGYGSSSPTPGGNENLYSSEEIGSTATLGCRGANGNRRCNSQINRPPPPVRRTSSISNPNAITIGTLRKNSIQAAECIYGILPHRQASNSSLSSNSSTDRSISSEVVEESQSKNRANLIHQLNSCVANQEAQRRQSMSDIRPGDNSPVAQRTPGSPKQINETIVQKQSDLSKKICNSPTESFYKSSNDQKSLTLGRTERSALIQSLNSKLTQQLSGLSFGNKRSSSPDRGSETNHPVHLTQRQFSHPPPTMTMSSQGHYSQGPISTAQPQSFKEALRAKLKPQAGRSQNPNDAHKNSIYGTTGSPVRRSISSGSGDQVADRARQWLANRAQVQGSGMHRDSLLEQIKKGTRLRKVAQVRDRSHPRLS